MTSPTGGFEVATGFLRVVADYRQAERDVDKFTRDVNGRLHDQHGRFVAEGEAHGKAYGSGLRRGLDRESNSIIGGLRGIAQAMLGVLGAGLQMGGAIAPIVGIAGAVGQLAPALMGLVAVATQAAGALLLVPAALGMVAATVATLKIGLSGVGDAFKEAGKAAGGAADATAAAEKRIAAAQREAKAAQEALTRARREAKEANQQLAFSVRQARIDEKNATRALRDAARELEIAQRRGNPEQIEAAQTAYEQAVLSLEVAADRTKDLEQAKADADKKGVEGSDQVKAALERQTRAAEELADAQKAAAVATAGVASALSKLAPNAQDFVRKMLSLKEAFAGLKLDVQQRLFAGLGDAVSKLAMGYLPVLQAGLGKIATVLNGTILQVIQAFDNVTSRTDVATILNSTAGALSNILSAAAPLLVALKDIMAVGAPILEELSKGIGAAMTGWAQGISAMKESGELKTIITDGLEALKQLGKVAADVFGIISGVLKAVGQSDGLFVLIDQINKLVNSMAGQQSLGQIFADLGRIGAALMPILSTVLTGLVPIADILADLVVAAGPGLNEGLKGLVAGLTALAPAAGPVGQALGALLAAAGPLLEVLGTALAPILTLAAGALTALATELTPVIKLFSIWATGALKQLMPIITSLVNQVLPLFVIYGQQLFEALLPLLPVLMQLATQGIAMLAELMPTVVAAFMEMLPVCLELARAFAGNFLDALLVLVPMFPDLARSGLQIAQAMIQILVAVLPLIPIFEMLLVQFINILVKSGALDAIVKGLVLVMNGFAVAMRGATVLIGFITASIRFFASVLSGAMSVAGKFAAGVLEKFGAVRSWLSGLGGRLLSGIGNLGKLLVDKGRDMIRGLWEGITSMGGWLKDQLFNWARNTLPLPFRIALGINSPSKVMADMVGRHIPSGIVAGAQGAAPAARRSLGDLARSLAMPMGGQQFAFAGAGAGGPGAQSSAPAGGGGSGGSAGNGGVYQINLHVDGKVFASVTLDAIKGNPRVVAATVDEGRRQRNSVQTGRERR